jgi:hypothetical protein
MPGLGKGRREHREPVAKSYTLIPGGRGFGPGDGKEVLNLLLNTRSSKHNFCLAFGSVGKAAIVDWQ